MNHDNMKPEELKELRTKAEAKLDRNIAKLQEESPGDLNAVLQELRVHQIELEMQNEELRRAQQELEESRSRYSDLYDYAPMGYFTFDKNGLVLEANLMGCHILEVERARLLKSPFHLYVHRDSQDTFYHHRKAAFTPGMQETCELTLVRKDGESFEARLDSIPVEDAEGQVTTCRTVMTDITEQKRVEAAMQESEHRYRSLFSGMTEGFALHEILCDEQGKPNDYRFLEINPAFETLTGLKRDEVIGKTIRKIMPDIEPVWIETYGRVALTGTPNHFEQYNASLKKTFEVVAYRPEPRQFACVFMDVTERRRMEEALFRSEERYRLISENTADVIWTMDLATQKFTYVSPSIQRLLGFKPEEVHSRTLEESLTPESWQTVSANMSKRIAAFLAGDETVRTQIRVIEQPRKDGTVVSVEAVTTILTDKDGRPSTLLGVSRDITERKRAEEALAAAHNRLVLAQQSAGAGIWDWDMATNELTWSPELFRLFGQDPDKEKASFDLWRKVLHPEDVQNAESQIERAVKNRTSLTNEYRVVLPGGETRWINALGNTMYDEHGQPRSMSGICIDITERKKAEQSLRESREELRHAQTVGHIGNWRLDVRNNVLMWSDENHRIFGIPQGTPLTYEAFLSAIHPDDRAYVDTRWKAAMAGEPYDIEHRIVVDEQIKWVREKATLEFDAEGSLLGGFGITQDITDRKRIEAEMQMLAKFPAENPSPVLRISAEGVILYSNEAGGPLLEQWERAVGQQIPAEWRQLAAKALQSGNNLVEEFHCGGRLFSCVLTPIAEERYVNLYGRDITQQKKAQQALLKAHGELQEKVKERTAELSHTVEILQKEIQRRTRAEVSLQERSRILEAFFMHTIAPLVILDRNFNFVRVNDAYAKACQREISDFEGHNHFEFYPHPENQRIFETVVRTKTSYQAIAKPFSFPDHPEWGVTYWDWILFPLLDEKNEVEFLVYSLENVTEQKTMQESVKSERKRLHDVLETLPAYVCLIAPDYHMPFANRVFRELFGESRGMRCYEFLFNRTTPCDTCETFKVLETKEPHHWEWTGPNGQQYDVFDFPFTDTDGSRLILEMGIDITEQKQAQESLRSASRYMRGLLEALLDPLVTISTDGTITDVNRATELVTGCSRDNLIGSDFSEYFTEPEKARNGYRKVLSEGLVRDYPLTIRHPSGGLTDVLYNATVYKNEIGQIQGVFAVARDVTERNKAEARTGIVNLLLELFAKKTSQKEYLDSVVKAICDWSGCRCVGVRLADAEGYIPYASCVGFSEPFLATEGRLSLQHDSCLCIRAITQCPEWTDSELVTPRGSFYSANTFAFLDTLTKQELSRYRGQCMKHGFASLAVVPIRYRDKILGAIHLADECAGKTSRETVEFLETMATLIGEAVHRFDVEAELRHSHKKLRSMAAELELTGENERRQIAVDLHDSIGQILCFSANELKALQHSAPEGLLESLPTITQQLELAIQQVRSLSFDLSPGLLYDLGLEAAVEELVEKFSKERNLPCRFETCPSPKPLADPVKILLYRSVRELLINIAKHAQARETAVSLRRSGDLLRIVVEDDGRGFQVPPHSLFARETKGFGLFSVRERLLRIGGALEIQPRSQGGTQVILTAPLNLDSNLTRSTP